MNVTELRAKAEAAKKQGRQIMVDPDVLLELLTAYHPKAPMNPGELAWALNEGDSRYRGDA